MLSIDTPVQYIRIASDLQRDEFPRVNMYPANTRLSLARVQPVVMPRLLQISPWSRRTWWLTLSW